MRRLLLRLAALPFIAAGVLDAQSGADLPATEPIFELPKLTVNEPADLPELERWHHTRLDSFEILACGNERDIKRLLVDFQKFRQAVKLVWPAPIKPLAASTLVLCGEKGRYDAFIPNSLKNADAPLPSLFLRNREQIAIVVDLETTRMSILDPMATLNAASSAAEYEVDHYRQLYREYIHYLLSQSEARIPAWLKEGLAQIIMDVELNDRRLIYGKIDTFKGDVSGVSPLEPGEDADAAAPTAVVGERPFNAVLQFRRLMPLDEFFAVSEDSEIARTPLGNNLWAKQAYAFVHYCMFGANLRHKEALVTFVGRLVQEPLSEELFKECFKTGYKGMVEELNGYLRHTRHKYQQYNLQAGDRLTTADIELTVASATQVGLIKGDTLQLAGHPEAAYTEYRNTYRRGSREPALLAGLSATVPNPEMAAKFADEAIKAGVTRPSAFVRQARNRLAAFRADPGPDGKLTQQQLAAVLGPLFKARSLPPPIPELYETIAEAWAASSIAPKPEHLAVLDEGVRRFPRNSALLHQTALLYHRIGAADTAAAIARLGLRFAADEATKAQFNSLLSLLPAGAGLK
ncbi:hypothetical protein ESB00_12010 [Oleiharenicola lentus]|uniref:DUF1570 domain-containing protein n=1 Tax=Oleiharenicola lentus TaxID=2508720 RepID=A0A4Q1CBS9_9BACT|nr:hypothetical protein [Oleiharenicola lentus]RXK56554.1 hypothetical protein ESB00_12010 [Oleiharenicola lentus]